MKQLKTVLTVAFIFASLAGGYAQHYIGLRAGYGSGSVRLFPVEETKSIWGLYSGGLSYKFYSDVKYVGAIQIDLQLLQKGFKWMKVYDPTQQPIVDTTTSYSRRINTVEMPIMWQPHFYLFNRSLRVFINLGVTFSYNFSSTYKWESQWSGIIESGKYDMITPRDNSWGYGLCGGGGLGLLMGRFEVNAEARYYFGYADILRNKTKYAPNPIRSPLDNLNISLGVYYRLGKGGIRSAPSKRLAEKIKQRELDTILGGSSPKVEKQKGVEKIEMEPTGETETEKIKIKETKNGDDKTTEGSKTDTERH